MVEAVKDLKLISKLANKVNIPIMLNQLHGGKSPNWSLQELQDAGVGIVIYSTPCLLSAQRAMELYLDELYRTQRLPEENTSTIGDCNHVLFRRETKPRYPLSRAIGRVSVRPGPPRGSIDASAFHRLSPFCLAAVAGGAINAVAGGGTLVTFPALLGGL